MSFWIAYADAAGARITGTELELMPGPSSVEYPNEVAGGVLETANGRVVHQQPSVDARRRSWVWEGYPADYPDYERTWAELQLLRSRWRFENGLSPYVFVKDAATRGMDQRTWINRTTNGAATLVFTSTGATWTVGALVGARVTFPTLGRRGIIVANTASTFTLDTAVTSVPTATPFIIAYETSVWVRARVLDVSRELRQGGGNPVYESTRMTFVIDDPNFESVR